MIVLAKTRKGSEFIYNASTAHKVSERKADKILEVLNGLNYDLKPGETWHKYEVSYFEKAAGYAEFQRFVYHKNGLITRRYS